MKKSHRVAHENQRRGGFCYYHYTTFIAAVKITFSKKNTSSHYFLQYNFFCTIVDATHSLNPFPLIILSYFFSYRLSFLHLTNNALQSVLCLLIYVCKISPSSVRLAKPSPSAL